MNKVGMGRKNANTATGKNRATPTNTAQLKSTVGSNQSATGVNQQATNPNLSRANQTRPIPPNSPNATIPPRSGTIPPRSGTIPPGSTTIPPRSGTIPPGSATSPLSESGHFPVAGDSKSKASKFFKLALLSLLLSLAGLSYIFGFQVEMKGAGAYLYLFVMLFAFLYIVSTMIYVLLSTRNR